MPNYDFEVQMCWLEALKHLTEKEQTICLQVLKNNTNMFTANDDDIKFVASKMGLSEERVRHVFERGASRAKQTFERSERGK